MITKKYIKKFMTENFSHETFTIDHADKFYPEHNSYIWTYCIFLGKFTDSNGENYDLGVCVQKGKTSVCFLDATTYGPEGYQYSSGVFSKSMLDVYKEKELEWYVEAYRRANILNIFSKINITTMEKIYMLESACGSLYKAYQNNVIPFSTYYKYAKIELTEDYTNFRSNKHGVAHYL